MKMVLILSGTRAVIIGFTTDFVLFVTEYTERRNYEPISISNENVREIEAVYSRPRGVPVSDKFVCKEVIDGELSIKFISLPLYEPVALDYNLKELNKPPTTVYSPAHNKSRKRRSDAKQHKYIFS